MGNWRSQLYNSLIVWKTILLIFNSFRFKIENHRKLVKSIYYRTKKQKIKLKMYLHNHQLLLHKQLLLQVCLWMPLFKRPRIQVQLLLKQQILLQRKHLQMFQHHLLQHKPLQMLLHHPLQHKPPQMLQLLLLLLNNLQMHLQQCLLLQLRMLLILLHNLFNKDPIKMKTVLIIQMPIIHMSGIPMPFIQMTSIMIFLKQSKN